MPIYDLRLRIIHLVSSNAGLGEGVENVIYFPY